MVRFDVRKIAILLLLAAPAAQAQPWQGPAAVEVRVEDQKGLPVAGAQVQLKYTAVAPLDGPAPVTTDARGHATLGGLAAGSWRLSVSHDGFMTYQVEMNVREAGRPATTGATQIKVSDSLRTMEVQVSRARSASSPSPAPTRVGPVRPVETAPRQEEPTPTRAPRPQPPPAPTPTPTPVPKPEKETQAAPPHPAAPPAPARVPTPKPMPPPAQAPAPAPAPTPEAPAPTERLRTFKDRNCVECQPGESALSLEWTISPGGTPGCGGDIAKRLAGGDVPSDLPVGCHVLRIALPAGAHYTAYRFEIQVENDSLDCPTGKDCPRSMGRWPMDPVLVRGAQGTVILAPFEPGPSQADRRAVLTVYFTEGKRTR